MKEMREVAIRISGGRSSYVGETASTKTQAWCVGRTAGFNELQRSEREGKEEKRSKR